MLFHYNLQININMPLSLYGILLIGTWVSILVNLTSLMNYVKVIVLHDKGPSNKLSCETIWFHQKLKWLVFTSYHKNNIKMTKQPKQ
jgi:hypothetical protein